MYNYFLKFKRKRKGFTLLELIVVIVILGLLASLAIPTFKKIINQTQLKVAEVTAASVARETIALAGMDVGLIQESHIKAAVNDLPGGLNEPVVSASDTGVSGYQVVFGKWEFSGHPRTLSVVRGGEPQGTSIGVALAVPGVGCAFARNDGNTVKAWSVERLDIENCNGAVAFIEPEEALKLSPPPTPEGINISFTCSVNGETGWDVTFDNALVDVYINGKYAGTYASGTCIPGSEDDVIVAVPNDSNTGQPGGWENGAGDVLDDEVIEVPTDPTPPTNPETNVSNPVTSDGKTPNVIIWSPTPGADSTIISRGPVNGPLTPVHAGDDTGSHYDTSPPGDYVYEVQPTKDGEPLGDPIKVEVKPVTKPEPLKDDEEALKAEILGDSALIAWGEVPDTLTAPLTGYKVYRSFNGGEVTLLGETLKGTTNYTDGPLEPGMYCYQLTAHGLGGESGKSSPSCVQVLAITWGQGVPSESKIMPTDAKAEKQFGSQSIIKDDTLIVSNANDNTFGVNSGSVYVFKKTVNGWIQEAKLLASSPEGGARFGHDIAFDGTTLLVSAIYEDANNKASSGAVYVFNHNGSTWAQSDKLTASNSAVSDNFGASVSLENNTILVGAPFTDSSLKDSGSVYVFTKSGNQWLESAEIKQDKPLLNGEFGTEAKISNGEVMIGAYRDNSNKGAVYTFTHNGVKWEQKQRITIALNESVHFGKTFEFKDGLLVVNSPNSIINGLSAAGAIYIFEKSSNGLWEQKERLTLTGQGKGFGAYIGVENKTIVASTPSAAPVVYNLVAGQWKHVTTLKPYGNLVAIGSNQIVVNAPADAEKGTRSGAVYVLTP